MGVSGATICGERASKVVNVAAGSKPFRAAEALHPLRGAEGMLLAGAAQHAGGREALRAGRLGLGLAGPHSELGR
jgi:hypothetical protein